jgi:hypothetical protein
VLYVRSGGCAGGELACNDDTVGCGTASGSNHGSRLTMDVVAGQTYFVVVDGYNGKSGNFSLTVTPPSGSCQNAFAVPAGGGSFTATTSGQSAAIGTCAATDKAPEHAWEWTPTTSGTASISTCGGSTNFDTVVYLRSSTCGGSEVSCNDDTVGCASSDGPNHGSHIAPTVTAGQTYFIFVDGYNGKNGTYTLTVVPPGAATTTTTLAATTTTLPATTTTTAPPTTTTTAPPATTTTTTAPPTTTTSSTSTTTTSTSTTTSTTLAGGTCGSPIVIAPGGGTVNGTTSGTGSQAGSCGPSGTSGEQVFAWTPTDSGIATIQTCGTGTNYDTILYVRGTACSAASEMACSDDSAGCGTGEPSDHHGSRVTLPVTAGQTYYVTVDGYGGGTGKFALTIIPPSGTCANPFTLPAGGAIVSRATTGGSQQSGTCATTGAAPEVVYQWVPGKSGVATLATCGNGTNFDTVLYVRSGVCQGGSEVACNDDTCAVATNDHWGSRVTPTVTAGQAYFVIVDGYNGASGTFTLNVAPPP